MRRRTMHIANIVTVAAVVAGFVGSTNAAQATTAPAGALIDPSIPDLFVSTAKTATTYLTVTFKADEDAKPVSWDLQCDPPGGDHPRMAEACGVLDAAALEGEKPFGATPKDQMCAFIHGGPQTATVKGTWNLTKVKARFKRSNGCEISRWNAIAPVLEPAAAK